MSDTQISSGAYKPKHCMICAEKIDTNSLTEDEEDYIAINRNGFNGDLFAHSNCFFDAAGEKYRKSFIQKIPKQEIFGDFSNEIKERAVRMEMERAQKEQDFALKEAEEKIHKRLKEMEQMNPPYPALMYDPGFERMGEKIKELWKNKK